LNTGLISPYKKADSDHKRIAMAALFFRTLANLTPSSGSHASLTSELSVDWEYIKQSKI
jgi:hypothetical protein